MDAEAMLLGKRLEKVVPISHFICSENMGGLPEPDEPWITVSEGCGTSHVPGTGKTTTRKLKNAGWAKGCQVCIVGKYQKRNCMQTQAEPWALKPPPSGCPAQANHFKSRVSLMQSGGNPKLGA